MEPPSDDAIVDVGIPAYLRPTYIVETVESVLAQTFPRWRLTISEDGPGGGDVQAAVEPYLDDPRIRYLPTGKRLGETGNWNRLLELATAPYAAILHDDDRWHPHFIAHRLEFMEKHPDCAFVFSGRTHIDERGELLGQWTPPVSPGLHPSETFAPRMLRANLVGSTVTVLIRRVACETVGYFDGRFPHADYEMWYRLTLSFPVGYLEAWDVDKRLHASSTTHQLRAERDRVVALATRLIELTERQAPTRLGRLERRKVFANVLLEEISFGALGPGHRSSASRLLADALIAYPPAILDERVLDWLRIAVGPRARRTIADARTTVRCLRGRRGRSSPA
ncbi:MAG: glycosyltransferase family 2 protein [Vicinamibacteria bacterium]